ncbi:MAG: acyl-CoA thioesterase [Planctomycetes bacterium]|nr:acyl-CoA thioesterase [Planctomycetota bacterium]MBI3847605.1 acyl-CoA thioesterase [Planctomycetota bacterium]
MTDTPAATYPSHKQPSIRELMMPRDTNALGTIFGGVILSSIDLAAAIEAHAYHHGKVVTVAMDQIVFKQPVFVGDLVSYFTETLKLGRTSITVGVSVWAQRAGHPESFVHVTEAKVTFVAVDDQLRPTAIVKRTRT